MLIFFIRNCLKKECQQQSEKHEKDQCLVTDDILCKKSLFPQLESLNTHPCV